MRWTSPTGDIHCTVTVHVPSTGADVLAWQQLEGWHCHSSLVSHEPFEGFCLRGTAVAPFLKSMYPAHHELKGVFVIIIAVTITVIIIIIFCQAALPWHCIELSAYCLALLN